MALFPGQPNLLDDFNRADENPLSGGGNWSIFAGATTQMRLRSDVIIASSGGGGQSYWTRETFGTQVAVAAKVIGWETVGGATLYSLYACLPSAFNTYYKLEFTVSIDIMTLDPGPSKALLRRVGSWVKTCTLAGLPSVITSGDQIGLYINDRSVEFWYDEGGAGSNWAMIDSADDAALSGTTALPAGWVGVGVGPAASNVLLIQMDDFCAQGSTEAVTAPAGLHDWRRF